MNESQENSMLGFYTNKISDFHRKKMYKGVRLFNYKPRQREFSAQGEQNARER